MQMRAGGEARHAHKADNLALAHSGVGFQAPRKAAEMGVECFIAICVLQLDKPAIFARPAHALDRAIAGGVYWGAGRGGKVQPAMQAGIAQNRMAAHAKARAEPRPVHRRFHQQALNAFAGFIIKRRAAVFVLQPPIGITIAAIGQCGIENVTFFGKLVAPVKAARI